MEMEKTGKGKADMVPHFLANGDANGLKSRKFCSFYATLYIVWTKVNMKHSIILRVDKPSSKTVTQVVLMLSRKSCSLMIENVLV